MHQFSLLGKLGKHLRCGYIPFAKHLFSVGIAFLIKGNAILVNPHGSKENANVSNLLKLL